MLLFKRAACIPRHMSAHVVLAALFWLNATLAWDYEANGDDWGDYGFCAGGGAFAAQSPIDLPASAKEDTSRKVFLQYPHIGLPIKLYNNGYSIAMTMPENYQAGFGFAEDLPSLKQEDANAYRLWQVNFHSPSEHTLNGQRFPLEMQMMHMSISGEKHLAVVVVLFDSSGTDNAFLDRVTKHGLPDGDWDQIVINRESLSEPGANTAPGHSDLDFLSVLKGAGFYSYTGSLTLPPCETQVQYIVRQESVGATVMQLEEWSNILKATSPPSGNFRNIQVFSTAASSVKLLEAVDAISGSVSDPAKAAANSEEPSKIEMVSAVESSKEMDELQADDSEELREAKVSYHKALIDDEANRIGEDAAIRNLEIAQNMYDKSAGPVEKIDRKWTVIDAQNTVNARKKLRESTAGALEKAAEEASEILTKEQSKATTKTQKAEGSVGHFLNYQPAITLPRGSAANPFLPASPHKSVTIDAQGGQLPQFIAPNLQQPDGPLGSIPLPGKMKQIITTPGPTTVEPSQQLVVQLPIDGNAANKTQLAADLAKSVAASLGVDPSRVSVPELKAKDTPVISNTGPVAGAAPVALMKVQALTRDPVVAKDEAGTRHAHVRGALSPVRL